MSALVDEHRPLTQPWSNGWRSSCLCGWTLDSTQRNIVEEALWEHLLSRGFVAGIRAERDQAREKLDRLLRALRPEKP